MVSIRRKDLLEKRNGGESSINSHSSIIGRSSTTFVVDTVVSRVNGNVDILNDDIVGGNDVDTTLRITNTTTIGTTIFANTTTNNVEKPERRGRKKTNKKHKEPESNSRKETNRKRKRSNCRVIDVNKPPLPELVRQVPAHLQGIIEKRYGAEAVPCLVMEKTLVATDINSKQGRLLFPTKKIHFKEKHCWVEAEKETECKRRNVRVLDPKGVWHDEIELRIWKSGCGKNIYVLTGKSSWNQLVKTNGFEAEDVIIVWSFKSEEKKNNVGNGDGNRPEICFVIAMKEEN